MFTLNDLENNFPTLNQTEQRIIDSRKVGFSFLDMNDQECQASATGIIFKVSVICGCQLPTHDAHINALESEFLIFLKEFGYGGLTTEEVLLAFRMNAGFKLSEKIEVYGAVFNIDYAGKVLKLYMDERRRLDYKLADKYQKVEHDKFFEERSNTRRKKVKDQYKLFLDGISELDLADCFTQLDEDGAFLKKRFDERFLEPSPDRGYKGDVFMRLTNWGEKLEKQFEAGRKAVMVLFEAMKKSGKHEIYTGDLKILYTGFDLPEEKVTEQEDLSY